MDPEINAFARSFQAFSDEMTKLAQTQELDGLNELGRQVQEFLGVDLTEVDPLTETFPVLQVVDLTWRWVRCSSPTPASASASWGPTATTSRAGSGCSPSTAAGWSPRGRWARRHSPRPRTARRA